MSQNELILEHLKEGKSIILHCPQRLTERKINKKKDFLKYLKNITTYE